MEWSLEQDKALQLSSRFLKGLEDLEFLYIGGYAGVGKTTIAKEIAAASGLKVGFAAYTGKAAYVMRQKGCSNTKTIHSYMYKPAGESKSKGLLEVEMQLADVLSYDKDNEDLIKKLEKQREMILLNENRKPMFSLNPESELNDLDALIIDECSMVDQQMGEDLLSFSHLKIIVLGDPMQLPPVGSGGFFTNGDPDILLVDIHRQAKESGILRLATDVRIEGRFSKKSGYYGSDCIVANKGDIQNFQQIVLNADQILVGKNETRHRCNIRHRSLTGKEGFVPVPGDKVICLRNNHKEGLLNGSLWRVHESLHDQDAMTVDMTISSEEDGPKGISVSSWTHHFLGRENELKLKNWDRRNFNEFDYGNAITVHKAQGSQWDEVVLFDESGCFRGTSQRWLYTGVTRAAKKIYVVL